MSLPIFEWFEIAELVCRMYVIKRAEHILTWVEGPSPCINSSVRKEKSDVAEIKKALWFVFSTDKFIACEQFIAHHLHSGESVNVYLQGLLWGNIGTGLACAFVAGLPIWKKLWVSSRRAKLNVSQLLSRGQAVMKDKMSTKEPFAAATHPIETDVPLLFTKCPTNISCYRCSEANCYAKDCQYWPAGINASCYQ